MLVPVIDQLVKRLVRRRWTDAAPAGVRAMDAQIWLVRAKVVQRPAALWMIWLPCAAILITLTCALPACGAGAGLLLGGSASHALETTRRQRICDYIRLGFWPAFNVADAAITLGALALALTGWQFLSAG
jgi:lipoprotein signal peptidase